MIKKLNQNDIDNLIIEFSDYLIENNDCFELLDKNDLKGFFIWCIDNFSDIIRSNMDWSILQLPDWIQFLILYYRNAFNAEPRLCWIYETKLDTNNSYSYYNYMFLGIRFGIPNPNIEVGISLKKENLEGLWTTTVKSPLIFRWWANLISIEIPEDVRIIPNDAFSDTKFSKFIVPEGVIEIGENAFCFCSNLTQITLPRSLKKISNGAFTVCENLENVLIEDGLEVIGHNVFKNCPKLKQIHLPKSIKKIGVEVFDLNKYTKIFYDGTKEDWYNVNRGPYNDDLNVSVVCSDEIVDYYYGYDVD